MSCMICFDATIFPFTYRFGKNFDEISHNQLQNLGRQTSEAFQDEFSKLLETYNHKSVQDILLTRNDSNMDEELFQSKECFQCKKSVAKNRCSRCHIVRYCSKDCQVKHWPEHRLKCDKALQKQNFVKSNIQELN